VRTWRIPGLVGVLLLAACSTGTSTAPSPSPAPPSAVASSPAGGALPTPAHVVVAVFENKAAGQVHGAAPFLDSLAEQGAALTDAHGETHPSEPNYLALFSGSTQGVTSDACPVSFDGDNLAAQLRAAGKSFVGYSESLPNAGYTGCSAGDYARKHAPWVDFPALPASVNQPLSAMPADYADLPTVAFVVPNLCDDMHDCSVETGDTWARQHLGPYVAWATTHDSLLIVTFDEDVGTAANHIATVVVGAGVRPGSTFGGRVDHYSLLRTLEDMYGLPPLGHAAQAAPLAGIWG
jgi:phosphatidylinositol-3-phosphatase